MHALCTHAAQRKARTCPGNTPPGVRAPKSASAERALGHCQETAVCRLRGAWRHTDIHRSSTCSRCSQLRVPPQRDSTEQLEQPVR